jgi:EmrB/QacA subfamily drug resistance transporter
MDTKRTRPAKEGLDPVLRRAITVLVVGALVPLLDSTMMNVAIHTIAREMRSSISTVQWVATSYILAMGLVIPVSGWATKRFGCKNSYIFSLVVFLVGSVASMLSWDIGSLIAFRVIQGLGAGLLVPVLQTELVQISGGRNLGRLMSIISVPGLLGPILGPVLGGIIVSSLSWRAIFWINIPICLVAIPLSLWGIPADKAIDKKAPLDWLGLGLLSPAFALLVYGIVALAREGGVGHSAILPLLAGAALLAGYIAYALGAKKEVALDLRLFKARGFSASNILLMLQGMISGGVLLLLPLYYQEARGASALEAGLWLLPQGIGMLLTRGWAGREADRSGARNIVVLSLAAIAIGTLPLALGGADPNPILLSLGLLIRGTGLGGLFIAIMASAYVGLPREQAPHASTATRIFNTLGGAFGSAILATIYQGQVASHGGSSPQAPASAFSAPFLWAIGFTLAAAIPVLFLRSREVSAPNAVPKEAAH